MDLIKDSGHDQGVEINDQTKPLWNKLSGEELARLGAKREEIIMVLRLWHGYGRGVAGQTLNNWLYDHAQEFSGRAGQTPLKHNPRRLRRPDA
jgi:hypothetical protein